MRLHFHPMAEDHFLNIYKNQGEAYHQLIEVEDVDGNLQPTLESITSFEGKHILDLATGTGRLPLLFPQTNFTALDMHTSMLLENKKQREQTNGQWNLIQADMRTLPLPSNHFDVVTTGWALGHFNGWYPLDWQQQILRVFSQVDRALKSGGTFIILETLTTGSLVPAPPTPGLAKYYRWLETAHGFQRLQVQTDYLFSTLEQAIQLTRFFFGEDLAIKVRLNKWVRLPEWTGIWYKHKHGENLL